MNMEKGTIGLLIVLSGLCFGLSGFGVAFSLAILIVGGGGYESIVWSIPFWIVFIVSGLIMVYLRRVYDKKPLTKVI